jgi:hypothetical protein
VSPKSLGGCPLNVFIGRTGTALGNDRLQAVRPHTVAFPIVIPLLALPHFSRSKSACTIALPSLSLSPRRNRRWFRKSTIQPPIRQRCTAAFRLSNTTRFDSRNKRQRPHMSVEKTSTDLFVDTADRHPTKRAPKPCSQLPNSAILFSPRRKRLVRHHQVHRSVFFRCTYCCCDHLPMPWQIRNSSQRLQRLPKVHF